MPTLNPGSGLEEHRRRRGARALENRIFDNSHRSNFRTVGDIIIPTFETRRLSNRSQRIAPPNDRTLVVYSPSTQQSAVITWVQSPRDHFDVLAGPTPGVSPGDMPVFKGRVRERYPHDFLDLNNHRVQHGGSTFASKHPVNQAYVEYSCSGDTGAVKAIFDSPQESQVKVSKATEASALGSQIRKDGEVVVTSYAKDIAIAPAKERHRITETPLNLASPTESQIQELFDNTVRENERDLMSPMWSAHSFDNAEDAMAFVAGKEARAAERRAIRDCALQGLPAIEPQENPSFGVGEHKDLLNKTTDFIKTSSAESAKSKETVIHWMENVTISEQSGRRHSTGGIEAFPSIVCTLAGCEEHFDTEEELRDHRYYEHADSYCSTCDVGFDTFEQLIAHKMSDENDHIACQVCAEDFKTEEGRDRHVQLAHPAPKHVDCSGCGKEFGSVAILIGHIELNKCTAITPAFFVKLRVAVSLLATQPPGLARHESGNAKFAAIEETFGSINAFAKLERPVGDSGSQSAPATKTTFTPPHMMGIAPVPTAKKAMGTGLNIEVKKEDTHSNVLLQSEDLKREDLPQTCGIQHSSERRFHGVSPPAKIKDGLSTRNDVKTEDVAMKKSSFHTLLLPPDVTEDNVSRFLAVAKDLPDIVVSSTSVQYLREAELVTIRHLVRVMWGGNPLVRRRTFETGYNMDPAENPFLVEFDPQRFFDPEFKILQCPQKSCNLQFSDGEKLRCHLVESMHASFAIRCPNCMRQFTAVHKLVGHFEAQLSKCYIREALWFPCIMEVACSGLVVYSGMNRDGPIFKAKPPAQLEW